MAHAFYLALCGHYFICNFETSVDGYPNCYQKNSFLFSFHFCFIRTVCRHSFYCALLIDGNCPWEYAGSLYVGHLVFFASTCGNNYIFGTRFYFPVSQAANPRQASFFHLMFRDIHLAVHVAALILLPAGSNNLYYEACLYRNYVHTFYVLSLYCVIPRN